MAIAGRIGAFGDSARMLTLIEAELAALERVVPRAALYE